MELALLNKGRSVIDTLDTFESLIWTERYKEAGDFELVMPSTSSLTTDDTVVGFYFWLYGSDRMMIIESVAINSDAEAGDKFVVKGRSIEVLMNSRIIWNKTVLTGNFQEAIERILNENIISPTNNDRSIFGFTFVPSTDPIITALTIDKTYHGEKIYDVIKDLCTSKGIGFKITVTEDFELQFSLYSGTDRSYGQTVNPYVIFSPANDNLIKSNYLLDDSTSKTVSLVLSGSEDTYLVEKVVTVGAGAGVDVDRREMFVDATNVNQLIPEGNLTEAEYLAQVEQNGEDYFTQLELMGTEGLNQNSLVETFESEIDTSSTLYVYNEDFFMGDVVQVEDAYGKQGRSQVTEFIRSQDSSGEKMYPTFTTIPE